MSYRNYYRGRNILVTGGTGSIGSQIVEQLLALKPKTIRILSRDETRQLELSEHLSRQGHTKESLRFLIGDVRDAQRLRRAMQNIDFVFHAAAMKHVNSCEYNPFEAVQTNVIGTQNVITQAHDCGVKRVVSISTDKATSPENTMGATKLLSERLVVAAQQSCPGLTLCAVRFGNVIGSRGSLAPRILNQIREEGGAKLTHPDMTRFMMTIHDAVSLVLEAGYRANGGEIFILRMPTLKIRQMIEVIRDEQARLTGKSAADLPIKVVGMQPGEKLHEALITEEESKRTRIEPGGMFVVEPQQGDALKTGERVLEGELVSSEGPFLKKVQIKDLLRQGGVFGKAPEEDSKSEGGRLNQDDSIPILGTIKA